MIENIRALRAKIIRTALGAIALSGCGKVPLADDSYGAIAACEKSLTEGLVSPASYKRISATYNTKDFTFADYWEKEGGDACRPFTDGECEDTTKFVRALSAKNWLLSEMDIKAGKDPMQIQNENFDKPFPKLSTKKILEADREYKEWLYEFWYGKGKPQKHPAALVSIEYDAVNSYNASIRSTKICQFPPTDKDQYTSAQMY